MGLAQFAWSTSICLLRAHKPYSPWPLLFISIILDFSCGKPKTLPTKDEDENGCNFWALGIISFCFYVHIYLFILNRNEKHNLFLIL